MKSTLASIAVLVCFLCLVSDYANAAPSAPAPSPPSAPAAPEEERSLTFFDRIFNIPRSVIKSVNKNLNENGAKCPDGSAPVDVDGKGTCHDNRLGISKSALDSVNDFLNG